MQPKSSMEPVKFKFYLQAGMAMRGAIKQAIARTCFDLNLDYSLREEKGFLSSTLFYTGSGEEQNVNRLIKWLEQFKD